MRKTLLILTILFSGLSSFSQDSLAWYLQLSAKNNPFLQQKFSEFKAALEKAPQVGSLPDPELSTGIFVSPMELVGGKQLADLRLMQMFPWFGVLKAAKDEMSLMAKAKYESYLDARLQVQYDLQQTWYELYKTRQAFRSSERNLEILQSLERLYLVKFKSAALTGGSGSSSAGAMSAGSSPAVSSGNSGMQTMGGGSSSASGNGQSQAQVQAPSQMTGSSEGTGLTDLYRIQMEMNELENSIAQLRDQQSSITARFNSLVNRPMQTTVVLPDTLMAGMLNLPVSAIADSILKHNPMLGMLQLEGQSLEARKQMVTKMGYPMVGLGLNYSVIKKNPMSESTMNGKDMIMPMVVVTLPIYRKKYHAMVAETDLLKNANAQGYQSTANSLQSELAGAIQNYEDAKRRMSLYANQVSLVNQTLGIFIKSFASSGIGLSDLLRVRQQSLDYSLKQVDAIADFNTSIAKLYRLMAYSPLQ